MFAVPVEVFYLKVIIHQPLHGEDDVLSILWQTELAIFFCITYLNLLLKSLTIYWTSPSCFFSCLTSNFACKEGNHFNFVNYFLLVLSFLLTVPSSFQSQAKNFDIFFLLNPLFINQRVIYTSCCFVKSSFLPFCFQYEDLCFRPCLNETASWIILSSVSTLFFFFNLHE